MIMVHSRMSCMKQMWADKLKSNVQGRAGPAKKSTDALKAGTQTCLQSWVLPSALHQVTEQEGV